MPSSSSIGKRENPVRLTAFSNSTGVVAALSMTSLSSGTITRDAVCSENSSAPVMSPASSSTSPWRVDSCTIDCTSSRVKEEVTSSFGSIRISFRMWFADQFRRRNDGLDQPRDEHQRRRQQQRRLVRDGHGDVLGHHFAERDVQERHQQQGDGEGHNVATSTGTPDRFQRHGQEVVDRGLGHLQDQQRADGDAELGAGEHERDVFHGPQRGLRALGAGLGQRLDLAPARGHDGEFGGHEEGVADQQDDKPEDSCPVAHAAPAWLAGWPSPDTRTGRKQIRSIRRPSMRVTLSVPPTTSTVSPTAAMRPSWLMT